MVAASRRRLRVGRLETVIRASLGNDQENAPIGAPGPASGLRSGSQTEPTAGWFRSATDGRGRLVGTAARSECTDVRFRWGVDGSLRRRRLVAQGVRTRRDGSGAARFVPAVPGSSAR